MRRTHVRELKAKDDETGDSGEERKPFGKSEQPAGTCRQARPRGCLAEQGRGDEADDDEVRDALSSLTAKRRQKRSMIRTMSTECT